MWYFKQRKQEREAALLRSREAESALNKTLADIDELETQKASIFDLAARLTKYQEENHWAERLHKAYGA